MDAKVRIMIQEGIDPLVALRMVTLSPAEYFRLWDRGAIAPGRRADLVLLDTLKDFNVRHVWKDGRQTVRDGVLTVDVQSRAIPLPRAVPVTPPRIEQLRVPVSGPLINVIGVTKGEAVTQTLHRAPLEEDGFAVADPDHDLVKIVVMERHRNTGRLAVGFVSGLGIKRGAIASSVAHDAHNFVAAGVDDRSLLTALTRLCETGGGLTAAQGETVLGTLPLPIGGLMTDLGAEETADALAELEIRASELGIVLPHPFMVLAFLCLSVIPELKITDQGYVDITKGGLQPLFP